MGGIMSIILQGSTSGSVTLQEPAVAGTTVLTLPAVTGTVLTTTSPKAGNVIQVVSTTYGTQDTVASTSYTDTGLLLAITPTSATSKILIIISAALRTSRGTNDFTAAGGRITRAGTTIFTSDRMLAITAATGAGSDIAVHGQCSLVYLDSPSTTSSTTYRLQIKNSTTANSASAFLNESATSSITLMEIAA